MRVKICGIRTVDEAQNVCSYKPDAIGILVGFEENLFLTLPFFMSLNLYSLKLDV